jgi:hypothetical protein
MLLLNQINIPVLETSAKLDDLIKKRDNFMLSLSVNYINK